MVIPVLYKTVEEHEQRMHPLTRKKGDSLLINLMLRKTRGKSSVDVVYNVLSFVSADTGDLQRPHVRELSRKLRLQQVTLRCVLPDEYRLGSSYLSRCRVMEIMPVYFGVFYYNDVSVITRTIKIGPRCKLFRYGLMPLPPRYAWQNDSTLEDQYLRERGFPVD